MWISQQSFWKQQINLRASLLKATNKCLMKAGEGQKIGDVTQPDKFHQQQKQFVKEIADLGIAITRKLWSSNPSEHTAAHSCNVSHGKNHCVCC